MGRGGRVGEDYRGGGAVYEITAPMISSITSVGYLLNPLLTPPAPPCQPHAGVQPGDAHAELLHAQRSPLLFWALPSPFHTLSPLLLPPIPPPISRVLVFSQMTRMLDILEDYCLYRAHPYCRIDGNTSGEDREYAIDTFNKPDSEK